MIVVEGKVIPDFENYLATKDGKIINIKRNKELKQEMTKDGYMKVTLYKNGKGTTKKTHRFIALAFIPNPDNLPQVNHIDGNKTNNNIENLEWVTGEQNRKHARENGLINSGRKAYETRLKKYGKEYLSKKGSESGGKADCRKGIETKKKRYGENYFEKLRAKNVKVIDVETNFTVGIFESRAKASKFLGVVASGITKSIKFGRIIKHKYKCEEGA